MNIPSFTYSMTFLLILIIFGCAPPPQLETPSTNMTENKPKPIYKVTKVEKIQNSITGDLYISLELERSGKKYYVGRQLVWCVWTDHPVYIPSVGDYISY